MKGDGRSLRVALVGDGVLNPAPRSAAERLLVGLVDGSWGLVHLPPALLDDAAAAAWRANALDQVSELRRHGLVVVVVLSAADEREREPLQAAGLDVPELATDSDVDATLGRLSELAASTAT